MEWWIISHKRRDQYVDFESTSNYRFETEAKEQGITLKIIAPEQIDLLIHREDRKSILLDGEVYKLPDFVIPRYTRSYYSRAIVRHFERLGVFVLNGSESIEKSNDKLYSAQVLAEHNLPVPNTLLAKFPVNIDIVEKQIWFPVVIKTLDWSQWTGVFLSENKKEFQKNISMIENIGTKDKIIIFQEFIENSRGRDLRVFVVGGKVVACMQRIANWDDFRANYSLGGSVWNYEITPEIEWIASQSANLIWLEVAGVDLLFDKDMHLKICEINASPGLLWIEKATEVNIAREIFNYIRIRCGEFR